MAAQIELVPPTSFSALSSYRECKRRFYWERVNPLPLDEQMLADRELRYGFGRFFHDRMEAGFHALNADLNEQRRENPLLPVWYNLGAFIKGANEGGVPSDFLNRWAIMMGHVVGWLQANQSWLSVLSAFTNPIVEEPFALNQDWDLVAWDGDRSNKPEGLAIRGFLDLYLLVPEHTSVVSGRELRSPMTAYLWDWKTSTIRSVPTDPKTKEVSPQLELYAFALFRRYPKLEQVVASYFNVRWAAPEQPVIFTREQAESGGPAWVIETVEDIMDQDPYNVESWEPSKTDWCYTCEYNRMCPLMKRLRYEKARKRQAQAEVEAGV